MSDVHIVDYGASNLLSLCRAVEAAGGTAIPVTDPAAIGDVERLIIPGVGAFGDCARTFAERGWIEPTMQFAASGRSMLGICVGMQMLFDYSLEFGRHEGLGLIPGHVERIAAESETGTRKVPNIGWSTLMEPPTAHIAWQDSMVGTAKSGEDAVYFVHSYACVPNDPACRTSVIDYFGETICASVEHDNIAAMQFHPEKSGTVGLAMLAGFIRRR
jgi:imidazole glycerol-phosphate synthase subunit HisH